MGNLILNLGGVLSQSLYAFTLPFIGGPLAAYICNDATSSPHVFTFVAVVYNMAQAIFGGLSPVVCTGLVHTLNGVGPGLFISAAACMSLTGLYMEQKFVKKKEAGGRAPAPNRRESRIPLKEIEIGS